MIKYFDSHAHYNDEKFDEDRFNLIEELYKNGVTNIVNAGYNVESTKSAIELAQKYEHIYATSRNISKRFRRFKQRKFK